MPKVNKHTAEACGAGLDFILRPTNPRTKRWLPRITQVKMLCDSEGKEDNLRRLLRPGLARKCPRCSDVWDILQKLKHHPSSLEYQIEEEKKIPHDVESTRDPQKCYETQLYVGPLNED